ncbi:NAC domain-containing protein 104-like [Pistacia vera]|uniref:NAC domain-containing protein 104-like n=1 Tax=Pistacia vera TaxID=55513 RepID=UPI0012633E76|nr:NAC domain-containing protein 104-like [Pistacia vera]
MCDDSVNLPPGFRFLPTDEELVLHFLYRKASLLPCHPNIIPVLDPYFHDPWQLNGKALCSGNQWYFFSQMMENRVSENGYWKDLDFEQPIFTSASKQIGVKKHFLFFIGKAPSGVETSWVLQEYHLCDFGFNSSSYKRKRNPKLDCYKWVLCRVYERENNSESLCYGDDDDTGTELSCLDEMFLSLEDDLADISLPD